MQREASETSGKLQFFHVQLRLITVVSRLVSISTAYSARFVALSYGTLRSLSRYVTVISPREKVQVGKVQEKAQSEKDSHSKNRGGKKTN